MSLALASQVLATMLAVTTTPVSLMSVLMDDWFKVCNGTFCCKDLRDDFHGPSYTAVACLITWALLFLLLGTILTIVGVPAVKRRDSVKQQIISIIIFSIAGLLQTTAGIVAANSLQEVKVNAITHNGKPSGHGYFKTLKKFIDGSTGQEEPSNVCHVTNDEMIYGYGTSYALLWISVCVSLASQLFILIALFRVKQSKRKEGYSLTDSYN